MLASHERPRFLDSSSSMIVYGESPNIKGLMGGRSSSFTILNAEARGSCNTTSPPTGTVVPDPPSGATLSPLPFSVGDPHPPGSPDHAFHAKPAGLCTTVLEIRPYRRIYANQTEFWGGNKTLIVAFQWPISLRIGPVHAEMNGRPVLGLAPPAERPVSSTEKLWEESVFSTGDRGLLRFAGAGPPGCANPPGVF
jgi:hypothetical protein